MASARDIGRFLLRYKNQLIIFLTPLLLLPLPLLVSGQEALCGYCLLLLATLWCSEALPIAATGLVPVFLFPLVGLLPYDEVVTQYMKETLMLFIGGIAVAIALEKNDLHKRIALTILRAIGTQPKWLMLGFMFPTWFLSMWISNTAATAMMIPMVEAVLEQIKPKHASGAVSDDKKDADDPEETKFNGEASGEKNASDTTVTMGDIEVTSFGSKQNPIPTISGEVALVKFSMKNTDGSVESTVNSQQELVPGESEEVREEQEEAGQFQRMSKGFLLSVAYAANVGGVSTLTGTTPNIILKGFVDDIWAQNGLPPPIDYPTWMLFGMPIAVICLFIVWYWMQFFYLGIRQTCDYCSKHDSDENATKTIKEEYAKLGPLSFAEGVVGLSFFALVCLWFFRDPDFLRGWAKDFPEGYLGDACPAILIALSLFFIPDKLPDLESTSKKPCGTLMDWETMHRKMPWGTMLITGGGFALAEACMKSGLADWIGNQLQVFDALPGWAMVMILCLIVSFITNVTSNTAICTLLMPIMAVMAEKLGKNPLYLMLPVCVTTSFAFMLPVGTPPNAIVFSSGKVKVMDMVKAGIVINVLCVLVVTLATETWGMAYFDLTKIPWENSTSASVVSQPGHFVPMID